MTLDEFERFTRNQRLMGKTKRALRRVMVHGATWRDAARFADVYESTIMRARNRLFADRLVVNGQSALLAKSFVPKGQELLLLSQYRKPKYEGEVGALVVRKSDKKALIQTRIILERNIDVQQDPRPLPPGHGGGGQLVNLPVGGKAKEGRSCVVEGQAANPDHRIEAGN